MTETPTIEATEETTTSDAAVETADTATAGAAVSDAASERLRSPNSLKS